MENPLWHKSLAAEHLLLQRAQRHPRGYTLSMEDVRNLVDLLVAMRKELPHG